MQKKISPTMYAVCAVILACLTGLLFGSCSSDGSVSGGSCTVMMEDAFVEAGPVKLVITWEGTSYTDLAFTIDGTPYTLVSAPTVNDPVFRLETGDGVSAVLQLAEKANEICGLHITETDSTERLYVCEQEEMADFYAWVRSN